MFLEANFLNVCGSKFSKCLWKQISFFFFVGVRGGVLIFEMLMEANFLNV